MSEDQADKIIETLEIIGGLMFWIAFYVSVYISFCLGPVYRLILARWRRWVESDTCRRKP